MKTVSFYDPVTGRFTGQRYRGPDRGLPSGLSYVDGEHDPARFRVEDGVVVAREAPQGHVWHAPTATFVEQSKLDAAKRDAEARAEIDRLERSQPRAHRELVLGDYDALERLRVIDAKIAELRKELAHAL
jgi:hypothetical protein